MNSLLAAVLIADRSPDQRGGTPSLPLPSLNQGMARVNIEDSIYRDERFHQLSAALGKLAAIGACVTAWDLAARFYNKSPTRLIPEDEWRKIPALETMVSVGLAERRDGGVYVKGSKQHCAYQAAQQRKGKAGALKRWENSDSPDSPAWPSSSSSSSSSASSSKNMGEEKKNHTPTITPEDQTACMETWKRTLRYFGGERDLLPAEETAIVRSVQRYGARATAMALAGPREQPKDEKFDPGKFLNLSRILSHDKFNLYLNLGAQLKKRKETVE